MPLRGDKRRNGIDKPNPDPYSLIVRHDNEAMDPLPPLAHWKLQDARVRNDLPVIDPDELPRRSVQVVV